VTPPRCRLLGAVIVCPVVMTALGLPTGQTTGVLDETVVSDWCERSLGAGVAYVLFRSGYLSQVIGAALADGRPVVVKVRPFEPRIAGCVAVQARLAATGFPCPLPLAGPVTVGGFAITAETYMPGGEHLPREYGAAPSAGLLARLVASAPGVSVVPSLAPSPPWAGWDHPGARLWPDRDDEGGDLNQSPGPDWVDRAAGQVRRLLSTCRDLLRDFITCYQAAVGARWTGPQVQQAWAAGLWVLLSDAKKEAVKNGGGPRLGQLVGEIDDRLTLAGLDRDW
jgi:hypothetical protein